MSLVQTKPYQKVQCFYEPTDFFREKDGYNAEMSREDHGFLCGLIKERRPRKILEVGVSGGGTTAVIMKALQLLDVSSEVHSVDVRKQWYRDASLPVGHVYLTFKEMCKGRSTHQFHLGKSVAGYLDDIQDEIDFVIIDTTHILPGELLDFLAVYPYLTKDSMIVMHDIMLNYGCINPKNVNIAHHLIATKLLFSTLKGIKYYNHDTVLGNIAAVATTRETEECLRDIFFLLEMDWSYVPSQRLQKEYHDILKKNYDDVFLKIFNDAFEMEKKRYDLLKDGNVNSAYFMNMGWAK